MMLNPKPTAGDLRPKSHAFLLQGRPAMSVSRRLVVLTLTAVFATTAGAAADDTDAYSSAPTAIELCGGDDPMSGSDGCKDGSFAKFSTDLDHGLQAALAKAPANVRPLLKRDQYLFADILANAIQAGVPRSKTQADRDAFTEMLQRRVTTLGQMAQGFGRLAIDTDSGITRSDDSRFRCQANAMVKPAGNGWFAGEFVFEPKKPEDGDTTPPLKPLPLKLRRQGETLRIVSADLLGPVEYGRPENCKNSTQITGSYFASGNPDATDKSDTAFVAPSLDCLRPVTGSDEETCADPDLALQDLRLNRAWKALLPRLDETTRRALTEDQRLWLRQQAGLYRRFDPSRRRQGDLRPHHVGYARFALDKLQRERIALLEGFDENRKGLLRPLARPQRHPQRHRGRSRRRAGQGPQMGMGRLQGRLRIRHGWQDHRRHVPLQPGAQKSRHAGARSRHADRQPARRCLRQKAARRRAPKTR